MHDEIPREGPQILIVDDYLETLNLLQIHLSAQDYNVEIAVNGYDALEKLQLQSFDLVITDISMPGMGGNELCHIIRETAPENLPVIAMTAEPWKATADFTRVIPKPFRVSEISEIIRETLAESGKIIPLQERTEQK